MAENEEQGERENFLDREPRMGGSDMEESEGSLNGLSEPKSMDSGDERE